MNLFRFSRWAIWLPVLLLLAGGTTLLVARQKSDTPSLAGLNDVEKQSLKNWGGKQAKGFVLPGIDGKNVDVGKEFGKRPVVLVFYRGVW
jgi:hypothetical protein